MVMYGLDMMLKDILLFAALFLVGSPGFHLVILAYLILSAGSVTYLAWMYLNEQKIFCMFA